MLCVVCEVVLSSLYLCGFCVNLWLRLSFSASHSVCGRIPWCLCRFGGSEYKAPTNTTDTGDTSGEVLENPQLTRIKRQFKAAASSVVSQALRDSRLSVREKAMLAQQMGPSSLSSR